MDDMARPRSLPSPSPPTDFPVYGLEAGWPGPRCLGAFGEIIGDPVSWVSLRHQSPARDSLIVVETWARERTLRHVASHVASVLINVTLPVESLPRPDGILGALARHAGNSRREAGQWPSADWLVNSAPAAARVWRFADGWAAVSDAVPGVCLGAVGIGVAPDGLSLETVTDGRDYHFDLEEPLSPRVLSAATDAAGAVPLRSATWHADQLRLVS